MRRNTWISAIALTAGLLATFSLVRVNPEGASTHSDIGGQGTATRTPMRYTLQILRVAAEPFTYLPLMGQAVAATLPTVLADGSLLKEAEVTLTGVGPLRIGMSIEAAADALGLPLVPVDSNAGGDCAYYQPAAKDAALGLMVVNNHVIRVDIWQGSPLKTASGIAVGSTEAEVLAAYADYIEATPNAYTGGQVLTFMPQEPGLDLYRLVFETDEMGNVIQYRAGQFPAVTWPDGCV